MKNHHHHLHSLMSYAQITQMYHSNEFNCVEECTNVNVIISVYVNILTDVTEQKWSFSCLLVTVMEIAQTQIQVLR